MYFRVFLSLSKNSLEDSGEISAKVTTWGLSQRAIRYRRERGKNGNNRSSFLYAAIIHFVNMEVLNAQVYLINIISEPPANLQSR